VPAVEIPARPLNAWRADYGPDFPAKGIVTIDPPTLGKPFPLLVPQVDADGNERGGVRMPEVAAPLGTYTGWNLRAPAIGSPNEIYSMVGSFLPFPQSKRAREAARDPRASLEERYAGKDDYLTKIDQASARLVQEGFLLDRDRVPLRRHAGELWDWVQSLP
jgi:hypothetical protein